jgi:hypothetical protein
MTVSATLEPRDHSERLNAGNHLRAREDLISVVGNNGHVPVKTGRRFR